VIFEVTEAWLCPQHPKPTLRFVGGEQGIGRSLLAIFYRVCGHSGERTDGGSTLTTVDVPKEKRGFVPGNRRSTRRWMVGILVGVAILMALVWEPFLGWWGTFTVSLGVLVASVLIGRGLSLFSAKVDPWKGTAPGDRVGPTMLPRPPESPGEPFSQSLPPIPPTKE